MAGKYTYEVKKFSLTKGNATTLTKFQEFICKLIKVIPEIKYEYSADVEVELPNMIERGDVVMSSDGNQWRVVIANDNISIIRISTINPCVCNGLNGHLIIVAKHHS